MDAPRRFACLLALGLAASSQPARSAGFTDAPRPPGHAFREVSMRPPGADRPADASRKGAPSVSEVPAIRVPDVPLPVVDVSTPPASAAQAATLLPIPLKDVAGAKAPRVEPQRTGSLQDPAAPPPASITILPSDILAGAIELALADGKAKPPRRLSHKDLEALSTFYQDRGYRPAWVENGAWNVSAQAVIARLHRADEDGLNASDYTVPDLHSARPSPGPENLAQAEIRLSLVASLYARDAWGGRVDPARIAPLIARKLDPPTPGTVLPQLVAAADPAAALGGYNPAYPGYLALRAKLAELRDQPASTPSARLGREHRRVMVTQAIAVLDDGPPLGAHPAREVGSQAEDIIANMERWRWLPHAVPERYIAVNIPEFQLRVIDHGRVTHEARVITGKPNTPTPIFSDVMEYAIVNPSWYIPPSIMKKEILPGLAADPNYAAKRGYQVIRHGHTISVRQPPGERNALGFIKFMFPNNYAVYLHDTPNRNLFHASRRAFSHGCVRVDDPFALADQILGSAWPEARLKRLIGHGERTIRLPEKLPVMLDYFTTVVDEFGEIRHFEDLYGYNRKLRNALERAS